MSRKVPLAIQTKDELRQLKNNLAYIFGDDLLAKPPDVDEPISVPDTVCTDKGLSQAPQSSRSDIGSFLTFRDGGPFAMVNLNWEPGEGTYYSLGAFAGWHKYGSESDISDYHDAIDSVLGQLGVLHETVRIKCPCGTSEELPGKHTAVSNWLNDHYDGDEHPSRFSNSTLFGREITAVTDSENSSGDVVETPA